MAKVAEGSMVLTLDATKLNQGLKTQSAKMKAEGNKLGAQFKSSANEQIGNLFGGTSIVAGAGKAGAIGAGVAAAAMLGKELVDLAMGAKDFARELERSGELGAAWSAKLTADIAKVRLQFTEFQDKLGTAGAGKHIDDSLESQKGKLVGLEKQLHAARKEAERWDSIFQEKTDVFQHWMLGRKDENEKRTAEDVKRIKEDYEKQREIIAELEQKKREREDPTKNQAARMALTDYVQEQSDALRVLTHTATETDIAMEKLKRQFNFSDEQLAQARKLARMKEQFAGKQGVSDFVTDQVNAMKLLYQTTTEADIAVAKLKKQYQLSEGDVAEARRLGHMKQTVEANKEAKTTIEQMKNEMAGAFGVQQKLSEEFLLADLIKKNAGKEEIEQLRTLIDLKKTLNDQYKALTFIEKGSAAELSLNNRNKADNARDKKAEKLVDKFNELAEKQAEKQQKMLDWLEKIAENTGGETPEI